MICTARFVCSWLIAACLLVTFSSCRKKYQGPAPAPPERSIDTVASHAAINSAFAGYYAQLPPDYNKNQSNYPLLLFLHGAGQMGNGEADLSYLLNDGIGKLIKEGKFPVDVISKGKHFSFVVISPQYSRMPDANQVIDLLSYVRGKYRIDTARVYLSALSLGARVATRVAARFPNTFAALVPMAGVADEQGMNERCENIATHSLPVWAFHNSDDPMSNVDDSRKFISLIHQYNAALDSRLTIFDVYGHDAWSAALDPAYKENGMNIYEWMLQFSR